MEVKICPSCQEKNNPTFTQCWKCEIDFVTGKKPAQQPKIIDIVAERKKAAENKKFYFWIALATVLGLAVGFGLFIAILDNVGKLGSSWMWLAYFSYITFLLVPTLATGLVAVRFQKDFATVVIVAGIGLCISLFFFILMAASGRL